jgi:hypothetical protein
LIKHILVTLLNQIIRKSNECNYDICIQIKTLF